LRGREYGDDTTVKVPGEIDVQRAVHSGRIAPPLRRELPPAARARIHRAAAAGLLARPV
jgi:hypothetical protein